MRPGRAQLEEVLASLSGPALRYSDIRYTETSQQHVKVRNGEVDHLSSTVDRAVGVRVLSGHGWGFAATSDLSPAAIHRAARRAMEVAAASHAASTTRIELSDVEPHVASSASEFRTDPWSVPIDAKIA